MRFFVLLTGFREGTEVVSVLVYAPPDETLAKVNRAGEPGDIRRAPCDITGAALDKRDEAGDISPAKVNIRSEPCDISRAPCDVTGAALDRRGEAEDIGRAKVNIRSGPGGCRLPVTSNR